MTGVQTCALPISWRQHKPKTTEAKQKPSSQPNQSRSESLLESPLRVACSFPDPARSPISDDGDAGRTRDGRGVWRSVNSRSRIRSSLAQVVSGAMPWWSAPPAHASCAWWLASAFLMVAVARCCVQPEEMTAATPSISSLCFLLRWRPGCSSLSFQAIVVVDGGRRRGGELDFAVWEGAHPQWV